MASAPPPKPTEPPDRRAQQARNFLLYGFGISILLHLFLGPLIHFNRTQEADEQPPKTVPITVKPPPTPSPTPKPTPTPPPTPPPKKTPPPVKQTPQPKVQKIKIVTLKTKSTSSGPTEHENLNTQGSANGQPNGNTNSPAPPAPPQATSKPAAPPTATPVPPPTPTPKPACAVPSADPKVVNAVPPEIPEIAQQSGNSAGEVEVKVDLDAASHIVSASIYKSTNPVLNSAAITSTKQSTFQTEIVDCKPVAASYRFVVDFNSQ